MVHLELPWDCLITVLFRCFAYYMRQPNVENTRKTYQLATQLMDCIVFMSRNGRVMNALVEFFDHQIDDLDKLLAEKNETQP